MFKRAPRGYKAAEFPLPHQFEYQIPLQVEGVTKDSVIMPILRYSELANAPEAVFANPSHGSFVEEVGATCCPNSIVPRINFKLQASLSKAAIETDAVRNLRFMWFPIYTSFKEGLEAVDRRTGTSCAAILELETEDTNRTTQPIYAAVNYGPLTHPLSNVNDPNEVYGDWDLNGTADMEAVAFDYNLFGNALRYYSNASMLKTMIGRIHKPLVSRDKPYTYFSNNKTYPKVKRMNPHTFCGILVHLFQSAESEQYTLVGDTTAATTSLNITLQVQYDEWNSEYSQAAY